MQPQDKVQLAKDAHDKMVFERSCGFTHTQYAAIPDWLLDYLSVSGVHPKAHSYGHRPSYVSRFRTLYQVDDAHSPTGPLKGLLCFSRPLSQARICCLYWSSAKQEGFRCTKLLGPKFEANECFSGSSCACSAPWASSRLIASQRRGAVFSGDLDCSSTPCQRQRVTSEADAYSSSTNRDVFPSAVFGASTARRKSTSRRTAAVQAAAGRCEAPPCASPLCCRTPPPSITFHSINRK